MTGVARVQVGGPTGGSAQRAGSRGSHGFCRNTSAAARLRRVALVLRSGRLSNATGERCLSSLRRLNNDSRNCCAPPRLATLFLGRLSRIVQGMQGWGVSAMSLITSVVRDPQHPYRDSLFMLKINLPAYAGDTVTKLRGMVEQLRADFAAGLLTHLESQISAQTFDDLLDHAEAYLLSTRGGKSRPVFLQASSSRTPYTSSVRGMESHMQGSLWNRCSLRSIARTS